MVSADALDNNHTQRGYATILRPPFDITDSGFALSMSTTPSIISDTPSSKSTFMTIAMTCWFSKYTSVGLGMRRPTALTQCDPWALLRAFHSPGSVATLRCYSVLGVLYRFRVFIIKLRCIIYYLVQLHHT